MKKIKLNFSDFELSQIVLGCDNKIVSKNQEKSIEFLDQIYDLGINTFDSARGYYKSEQCLANWIKSRNNRKDIFLISKGCLPLPFSRLNPASLIKDLNKSLDILNTNIDLYFLHRDDRRADLKEIFKILNDYKNKGLIKNYGVSNWTKDRIEEANKICEENNFAPIVAVENNYSLLKWKRDPWGGGDGCVSISNNKEELDFYKGSKTPLFAYSPLARGFLSERINIEDPKSFKSIDLTSKRAYLSEENLNKLKVAKKIAKNKNITLPQLSLAYICQTDMIVFPIIGSNKINTFKKDIEALNITLSKEEIEELSK